MVEKNDSYKPVCALRSTTAVARQAPANRKSNAVDKIGNDRDTDKVQRIGNNESAFRQQQVDPGQQVGVNRISSSWEEGVRILKRLVPDQRIQPGN
jgi:hypothetical protein